MPDRIIVIVDARPGSAPGEICIAIPPASPWYELLPPFQLVEIEAHVDPDTPTPRS